MNHVDFMRTNKLWLMFFTLKTVNPVEVKFDNTGAYCPLVAVHVQLMCGTECAAKTDLLLC